MAIEKNLFREVRAEANVRLITFNDARRLMDELEAKWADQFADSAPINTLIVAEPHPLNAIHLVFKINNSEKL